jgi:hypothetical protein
MSLIQNSGNHCLHYPIAPTFLISGIVISSANAQNCEYSCTIICSKSFRGNTYNKSKVRRYWNCLSFISIYSCRNICYVTLYKRLTTIVVCKIVYLNDH